MAVLVIEAKYRSGSSITARYALKQGKNVFCLPHPLEEKNGVGTNNLLKIGAKLVTKPQEIGKYLNTQITQEKNISKQINNNKKHILYNLEELEDEYKIIYKELLKAPMSVNQIAQKLNLPVSTVNGYLTIMEIKGYINSLPGSEVEIKNK